MTATIPESTRFTLLLDRVEAALVDEQIDLIPWRRNDTLRLTPQGPLLLTGEVILTETPLRTPNLGLFL
ncbi:hypothetical protein K1T35_34240 [Pseudonocardia sp. DSM 110487]|uniref:hypothetical protein n=1 Tax=Pseudonocardia sp. DSM 110487 TaxID=2865833 RepID=UPI001C6A5CC4|nr:hypothetical protein [Pseudonocardia sp. DSM 110487]QYN33525.1 hypothetical protein K1T35_34240 [Pseudonocardia sp. DSM 110487]